MPSARTAVAGWIISAFSAYWLLITLGVDRAVEDDHNGRRTHPDQVTAV